MIDLARRLIGRTFSRPGANARYLYLHIPKTAGSAIKAAVARSGHADVYLSKGHDVSFADLTPAERRLETFVSIRNPVSWHLSVYNFKMHSESDKGYAAMERNSFEDYVDDVIYGRNGVDGVMRWNKPVEFKQHIRRMLEAWFEAGAEQRIGLVTLNFLYYGSSRWREILTLPDPQAALRADRSLIDVKHVLRQEHLQSDFRKMVPDEEHRLALQDRVNEMDSNPYLDALDPAAIAHIRKVDGYILSTFYDAPPAATA